jgi:thiol-disulfide isomerase/thioredoxin
LNVFLFFDRINKKLRCVFGLHKLLKQLKLTPKSMNSSLKSSKLILFLFFGLFISLTVSAQDYSESYVTYMSRLENYVQNELYGKVSSVLYDVEDTPAKEDFIAFVKEIQEEMNQFYLDNAGELMENEKSVAASFTHTMLIQLGELYLDRAQEMEVGDRLIFFKEYLSNTNLDQDIKNLSDDLARSLMMAMHSAMKVSFGMPSKDVADQINSISGNQGELLAASSIMNNMLMLAGSYEDSERAVSNFSKDYSNSTFLSNLKDGLIALEKLKTGSVVENFSFLSLEGEKVNLSDFKDKVIYLDLWASWCGPCINTFKTKTPDFEKQLREYEDIVLMYVSVDDQQAPWKNYLEKNPMRGVHVYTGKGFEAGIMKYFKVWGIPRYLIIGKDNKLFNANAPRPGDEAVAALLRARGA